MGGRKCPPHSKKIYIKRSSVALSSLGYRVIALWVMTSVIHGWITLLWHLTNQGSLWVSFFLIERFSLIQLIALSLFCHRVQSPCVSRRWRRRLWCRRQGTAVSGRHGPRTWPRKRPNPLLDARTPTALRCRHGNCPRASPAECCRRRACGLWRRRGNTPGSGGGEVRREAPAAGSWSTSGLRRRGKAFRGLLLYWCQRSEADQLTVRVIEGGRDDLFL